MPEVIATRPTRRAEAEEGDNTATHEQEGAPIAPMAENHPTQHGWTDGARVAHHCRFQGTPFRGLVPAAFADRNPAVILQRLALSLGFSPEDLADALRGAVDRKRPTTQLLLAPQGPARVAEQAVFDFDKLRTICDKDLPASHDADPDSFTEAAGRLREAFAIVADLAPAAQGANKQEDDDKSKAAGKRRMPHVASDSSDARGAVPARHLDYLASQECRDIEIEAAKTRGDRDVWQECARITRQHRGAGWAAIFSNGKSLERSADDGRLPGSILAAREALIEAIKALIIKVCLGPSERLREALEKRIAKVINAVLYGDFDDLEAIVAVMGASPSLPQCAEAGQVAGDPSMGRAGGMKETLQIDMPKALSRLSDLLLTVHSRAGDCPNLPIEGLRLTDLWHGASGLPLTTSKLPDGVTEVVGSLRLIEVALLRIGRAMRERRKEASDQPVDFYKEVSFVFEHELRKALDRAAQYQFAMAVSGKPNPKHSDSTHPDRPAKRDHQTQQRTDRPKQNQQQTRDNSRPPKRPRDQSQRADTRAGGAGQHTQPAAPDVGGGGWGTTVPRREAWMTFEPHSITHTVARRAGPANLVCAGEQLVAEASPNVPQNERPCIWHAIMKGGCKKDGCLRCKFRKAQIAAGKATAPIPAGLVAKLRAACTPAVAELLK